MRVEGKSFFMLAGVATASVLVAMLSSAASSASPEPAFSGVFGSGMVLPHDHAVILQGSAAPNDRLTLLVNNASYSFRSDSKGEWRMQLPLLRAGGPYTLSLKNAQGAGATLTGVLAGEVWLCSGQSNMELSVANSTDQPAEFMTGHPAIRLLTVAHQTALQARSSWTEIPKWQDATPESVRRFSALCYFFARKRITEAGVPIGLINASWGGSAIQPWIGEERFVTLPEYKPQVDQLRQYRSNPRKAELAFADDWVRWWQSASTQGQVWQRGALDGHAEWQDAPLKDWRTYADPRLKTFTGNLWFSASFELSEAQMRKSASFVLGKIDEVDTTWLNGRFVGNTFGYGSRREYRLEHGLLKAGTNQFSVFVTNTYDAGGMTGPEADVGIKFDDGEFLPLGNKWKYRIVPKETGYPPRAPWESVAGISGMFNGMIAPLKALTPTGVIWYQGESNADNAAPYGQLLTTLIKDWRTYFSRDLPFIVIQMPNYGAVATTAAESGWATLRHAQQQVALRDDKVGLVVTQDVGNDADIHPRLKYAVAERAARVARTFNGSNGIQDGVVAQITDVKKNSLTLEFRPVLAGDTARAVSGFSLCAAASGSCVATTAMQLGSRVEINTTSLPSATRLRYCWSDGGTCELKSVGDLPVSSFELPLARTGR
jgi:sialate O-acetylesterase